MTLKKILKSDIKELLRQSAKEWEVYAPVTAEEGDTLFTRLPKEKGKLEKALQGINLKDEWVVISPKDAFFPQLEDMFHFDKEKIIDTPSPSKKLIFGVRPCDAKGILFSDEFFKKNYEDKYYLSRAKDKLMIAVGCLTPPRPEACFCTSAKTGPFLESGFDLQLVDAGGAYLVEIGSDKGSEFVNAHAKLFKNSEKDEEDKVKKIKSKAAEAVNLKVDFEKALEIMKGKNDFTENYERIGERCIYCGGCLYVCPTCTCFNVLDDKKGDKGVRRRNWDGCVFRGYTREASGHNPRDKKSLRTTRRYEHKLKYDYSATGMSGCIACGRCLTSCPVKIGMSKFIEEITTGKRTM
ncbi:MAG: 4Fe-4S dicluster domain-containing protein [Omnitrophica bacterium]|nr:4Fe-4S dicluster domain-containing protein [Candidatus Omnitrophota bacterium]